MINHISDQEKIRQKYCRVDRVTAATNA